MNRVSSNRWVAVGMPVLAAIALVCGWQAIVSVCGLPPVILPSPRDVLRAFVGEAESLIPAVLMTSLASGIGLVVSAILATGLAIAFCESKPIRLAFFPYVLAMQTMPVVAIAPLLIVWLGYTFTAIVAVTVIVCLFPIVNSIAVGLLQIAPEHHDLLKIYGASRWQTLASLRFPSAVVHALTGLQTGAVLAVIGAIVAEFFVSNGTSIEGLGTLITRMMMQNRTDVLIAALFASATIGLAFYHGIGWIGRTVFARYLPPT